MKRWCDRPKGGSAVEDDVADLFRKVDVPVTFVPAERYTPAHQVRLFSFFAEAGRLRRMATVAALIVCGSAGAVIAAKGLPRRWLQAMTAGTHWDLPQPAPAHKSARTQMPVIERIPEPAVIAPAFSAVPPPATKVALVTPSPSAASTRAPERAAQPAAEPPESRLAGESRLLQKALGRLRQENNAAGALEVLDQYRAQYPRGLLRQEAAFARVDALLALDRSAEALSALDQLNLGTGTREVELSLIRAELRAKSDCASAAGDFDRVLRAGGPGAFIERALYGRAVCDARLGRGPEAENRLREYLQRFPRGRFAASARQMLSR